MENKELLGAISQMLDEKLEPIKADISDLKEDVSGLKEDVSGLKEDVSSLKEDVSGLKEDVSGLKEDVSGLKEDVSSLKEDVSGLKEDVSCLKKDVARLDARQTKMELMIENEIRPDIKLLAENYVPAAKMYREQADKIEQMQTDIALMKSVIREHSEILQRAALA